MTISLFFCNRRNIAFRLIANLSPLKEHLSNDVFFISMSKLFSPQSFRAFTFVEWHGASAAAAVLPTSSLENARGTGEIKKAAYRVTDQCACANAKAHEVLEGGLFRGRYQHVRGKQAWFAELFWIKNPFNSQHVPLRF